MKKLLLGLLLIMSSIINAQTLRVKTITPTKWVEEKTVVQPHHTSGNKGTGAVVGGTAGYLLIGGPIGLLGGALVGSSVSSGSSTVYYSEIIKVEHNGYLINTYEGVSFRIDQSCSPLPIINRLYNFTSITKY